MSSFSSSRFPALLVLPLWLAACAAGPDFVPPAAPDVSSYGASDPSGDTASSNVPLGGAQRFVPGGEVPSDWWHLFGSAALNRLIDQALAASPSIQAAQASLRAAEETAAASWGGFWPALSGSATDSRTKTSGSEKPMTLYKTALNLTYAPDVFGAVRRTYEGKQAGVEAAQFELEQAHLTLISSVTTAAVQEASLREQIKATKAVIDARRKQRTMTQAQFDAGAAAKAAVLAQDAALASTEAGLPTLENELAQTRHLLAVLSGRMPSEDLGAVFALDSFSLPEALPLSVPSTLVARRPDVRAALANLQAANADIGVATAAMMPQFSLTGSLGVSAARMADMFSPTTALWGLAAGLVQPLFQGGQLLHQKKASEAAFDRAAALYRQTVLAAFQDVADVLKDIETNAQILHAEELAERASAEALDLTAQQFAAGAVDYGTLLTAQTAYQQNKIALIQAQAARLVGTASLYRALGGGWWHAKTK